MRKDHNSGIPHGQSSPWSCQSFYHSVWHSICQPLSPPPGDGETGVSLPSSPSHISIKSAAASTRAGPRAPLALFLLFSMLAAVCSTPVVAADDSESPISVELDHDEADTWSSVLVTVRTLPFNVNNTSYYHIDREVRLSLIDLDSPKVIVMVYLNVSYGIGVFNFRILPDWGEFLMEIKVLDHNLTGASDMVRLKVVYSTDYALYLQALGFEDIAQGTRDDNAASNAQQERMTMLMFLIVFILLPSALLRLEHRYSRIVLGRSSWWDRFWDQFFNYQLAPPALHHYLEDEHYGFAATGRKKFRKLRLEFGREQVQVDIVALQEIDGKLGEEIDELTEKPPEGPVVTDDGDRASGPSEMTVEKGEKGDDAETENAGLAS